MEFNNYQPNTFVINFIKGEQKKKKKKTTGDYGGEHDVPSSEQCH